MHSAEVRARRSNRATQRAGILDLILAAIGYIRLAIDAAIDSQGQRVPQEAKLHDGPMTR